jgi:hypothetical protein
MSNLAKRQETGIATGYQRDAAKITQHLSTASEKYHLVAPATAIASVPEGCEVAISQIQIDADPRNGEVYDVGMGKFGLGKSALDRVAAAAGVTWDAHQSRRLDDGRDPRYCSWLAVGTYRHFDGTEVQIMGTKEMDLRPNSPQVEALEQRAAAKNKSADGQIREMRLHIAAHAETKARLRAIRSLGIRTAYTREELGKPFVVAKLMWTGATDDPTLRTEAFRMRAAAMMGGMRTLYGPGPQVALPAASPAPPITSVAHYYDDDDDEAQEAPQLPVRNPPPKRDSSPRQQPSGGGMWPWAAKKEGDPEKGTALSDVETPALERLISYYEKNPGDERWAARNAALADEARSVIASRSSEPARAPIGDGYDDRGDNPDNY